GRRAAPTASATRPRCARSCGAAPTRRWRLPGRWSAAASSNAEFDLARRGVALAEQGLRGDAQDVAAGREAGERYLRGVAVPAGRALQLFALPLVGRRMDHLPVVGQHRGRDLDAVRRLAD